LPARVRAIARFNGFHDSLSSSIVEGLNRR
jgi:hypothetical protein